MLPWASQHALRQGPLKFTPNSNVSSVTRVRQAFLFISPRKAVLRNARHSVQHPVFPIIYACQVVADLYMTYGSIIKENFDISLVLRWPRAMYQTKDTFPPPWKQLRTDYDP